MLDKKVTRDENVAWRIIGDEAVLLSAEDSSVHSLDQVGTRIWGALTASASVQEAYDTLLDEYDVTPEVLQQDMAELIEQLVENGLLALADG